MEVSNKEWKELKSYINKAISKLKVLENDDWLKNNYHELNGKRHGFIDVIKKMHRIERR